MNAFMVFRASGKKEIYASESDAEKSANGAAILPVKMLTRKPRNMAGVVWRGIAELSGPCGPEIFRYAKVAKC